MLRKFTFGGIGLALLITPLFASADTTSDATELSRWEAVVTCLKIKVDNHDYVNALSCLGAGTAANTLFSPSVSSLKAGALAAVATTFTQSSGSNSAEPATDAEKEAEMLTDLLSSKIAPEPVTRSKVGAFASESEKVKQQVQVAKHRGQLMKQLAEDNPEAFLRNVMPESQRSKFSTEVKNEIEQKVALTGKVEVVHLDDFTNHENSKFNYFLQSGGSRISLKVAGNTPAMLSGSSVRANGYKLGQTLVVAANSNSDGDSGGGGGLTVLSRPALESARTQRTLVILVTSPGQASTPTKEEMRNLIFSGNINRYYEEQSYGNVRFEGDVTDWISVPASSYPVYGPIELDQSDISSYISRNHIDLSLYDRVMTVVNGWAGGYAWAGKVDRLINGVTYRLSIGSTGWSVSGWAVENMSGFENVFSHEMGHELGVMHANSRECSGPSLDRDCRHNEYGNAFDIMGYGNNAEHFNAYYKDSLGWLDNSSKVSITQSGRYSLSPIEARTGVRAGIITNPATPSALPLYLEFRQPMGYDSILPPNSAGLQLNQVVTRGPYDWLPFPWLINANYATDPPCNPGFPCFSQPSLMQGSNFSWAGRGISIGSLVTTPTLATFDVGLTQPLCERNGLYDSNNNPYWQQRVAAGSSATLQINLTNGNTIACGPSTVEFSTSVTNSSGWSISQYPNESNERVVIAPGETERVYVSLSLPEDAAPGNRTVRITVSDLTNGRSYNIERTITVTARPTITEIFPSSGRAATAVTLKGTGFNEYPGNTININGGNLSATIRNVIARAGTLTFTFPTTFESYGGGSEPRPSQVPPPLGQYSIAVSRNDDGGTASATFTVTSGNSAFPTITSINPSSTTGRPTNFTIIGTNFQSGSMIYYTYAGTGSIPSGTFTPTFNPSRPDRLTFTTASLPKGIYTFYVKNPDGQISDTENVTVFCYDFRSIPLQEGSQGADVIALKQALRLALNNSYGESGREPQDYYGTETVANVKTFQSIHRIEQTGIVEVQTSAKLNDIFGCQQTTPTSDPIISSFTPESVVAGATTNIVVKGRNFQLGAVLVYTLGSDTGELPTTFTPAPIPGQEQKLTTGRYTIDAVGSYTFHVKNPDGRRSEEKIFVVTPRGQGTQTNTTADSPLASAPQIQFTVNGSAYSGSRYDVSFGSTVNIGWKVTNPSGAICSAAGNGIGDNLGSGSMQASNSWTNWTTPPLYTSTTYGIKCTNSRGTTYKYVYVTVAPQTNTSGGPGISITVDPVDANTSNTSYSESSPRVSVGFGKKVNIGWGVTNAGGSTSGITCYAAGTGLGGRNGYESTPLSGLWTTPALYTDTTYGIQCKNSAGAITNRYISIDVGEQANTATAITPPAITINGDSSNNQQLTYSPEVAFGGTANINWSVSPTSGTTCSAAGNGVWGNTGSGSAELSGSFATPPLYTKTTYGIRCTNSAGTTYKYITIGIQEQQNTTTTASTPAPTITITPPSASIDFGDSATFGWDVTPQTADTKCYAAGTGLGGAEGYQEIGLTGRNWVTPALYTYTTYGIKCTNPGGTTYKYVNVSVAPQQSTTCTEVPQTPLPCADYAGSYGVPAGYTVGNGSWTKNSCTGNPTYTGGCSAPAPTTQSCTEVPQTPLPCADYAGSYGVPSGYTVGNGSWTKNSCTGNPTYTGGCSAPAPTQSCTEVAQTPLPCADYAGSYGVPSGYTVGNGSWTKNSCTGNPTYTGGCSAPSVPTVRLSQNSSSGTSVTVTWSSDNADSCRLQYNLNGGAWTDWTSGGSSGSVSGDLTSGTWKARAICTGPGGTTTSSTITHTVAISSSPLSQTASAAGAFPEGEDAFIYTWNNDLQLNSRYAADIKALQTALAKEGVYIGEVTGGFHMQTYYGVKRFQEKYGIDSTGFVGPQTRARLNELY
ncbi:MAG: peptidoglycan-binding protein [bacterium]|nr:peptidoglycan-binding protein [bacterium]